MSACAMAGAKKDQAIIWMAADHIRNGTVLDSEIGGIQSVPCELHHTHYTVKSITIKTGHFLGEQREPQERP
jgi:hypothetical protein